jgi:hypothetical protein
MVNTYLGYAEPADGQAMVWSSTLNKFVPLTLEAAGAGAAAAAAAQAFAIQRSNHTGQQASSTISDFTEAVQDAVGAALSGTTGATVTYDDTAGTIVITGVGDPETMRDTIGTALVGVGNISVTVDDTANTITISTTATVNSTDAALRDRSTHTGSQTASTISDLTEAVQDVVGALVAAGYGVTVTYDDSGNTETVAASLTKVASVIPSDVAMSANTLTDLHSVTLAVGTWLVYGQACYLLGGTATAVDTGLAVGTATATITGPNWGTQRQISANYATCSVSCIVTVTVQGTVILKGHSTAVNTAKANSQVANQAGATGITAVRIA